MLLYCSNNWQADEGCNNSEKYRCLLDIIISNNALIDISSMRGQLTINPPETGEKTAKCS